MSEAVFLRAMELAAFPASGKASVTLNGWRVLIAKVAGEYLALNDRCTHAASPLSTGRLRHGAIMCPLHGARFDLASGKCIGGAYRPVRGFPVRVAGQWLEIAIPAEPPGISEAPLES
ncbi:MAG: hypothetical protein RIQ46_490 [Pseudomonadota bacterium]